MARSGKYRSLASIAILRLSESELRLLHSTISDMSASSFLELVRDIEDEIDSSIHLSLENFEESSFLRNTDKGIFREIDHIRRKELQITVQKFAELLAVHLKESLPLAGNPVPNFDSRRGLQAWINKLVRAYGEKELFHALSRIRKKGLNKPDSAWKLR